ncbi:hypothetical protein F0Q45_26010 [Mycobacterium simiae]|uniref:Uncharacterized protein n=1 Tax=Mycobacterium simiae TaxID=1784 RepID=A0A5B1B5C9_MYCSI|nr:hypothetical protein [Mycobacterium simiae]KAA1242870.1 hypothetical protein F0Q45_26010 [Mycobacterium simiae]
MADLCDEKERPTRPAPILCRQGRRHGGTGGDVDDDDGGGLAVLGVVVEAIDGRAGLLVFVTTAIRCGTALRVGRQT